MTSWAGPAPPGCSDLRTSGGTRRRPGWCRSPPARTATRRAPPRPSDGGQPKVAITPSGAVASRIVYWEVDDGTTSTLWRRAAALDHGTAHSMPPQCSATWSPAGPGPGVARRTRARTVWRSGRCRSGCSHPPAPASRPGLRCSSAPCVAPTRDRWPCHQQPTGGGHRAHAVRGYRSTEFRLTSTSSDPDGDALTLQWTRPGDSDLVSGSERGPRWCCASPTAAPTPPRPSRCA